MDRRSAMLVAAVAWASLATTPEAQSGSSSWDAKFRELPQPSNIRASMERLSARPHHVGSPYDKDNAEWMLARFKEWGWDAEIETFSVLFPTPTERVLELLEPTRFTATLEEPPLPMDPTSGQKDEQLPTYNAYSIDGDVTGPLVYVNYGRPEDYDVLERYGVLGQACSVVGTPALREMGTIGGNLCQRPRCWYFRRGISCYKNGGSSCPAREGENQYHAIIDGGPCYVVHPSDPAVALTALDAEVEIRSVKGERIVSIEDFYVLPRERLHHETILHPGEVVTALLLPAGAAGGVQRYHKLMQREAWDFALVSIAGCRRPDGDVRIVLGGVAPRPWRVNSSIEEDVASGGLDEDTIATLAERALYDAKPLSKNGYKVELAQTLIRDVIRQIA